MDFITLYDKAKDIELLNEVVVGIVTFVVNHAWPIDYERSIY